MTQLNQIIQLNMPVEPEEQTNKLVWTVYLKASHKSKAELLQ